MNAFDFVITVAIGVAFGRVLTAKNVAISEAITAFLLLAFYRSFFHISNLGPPFFRRLTSSPPKMLFYKGDYLEKNLKVKESINLILWALLERKVMVALVK